MRVLLIGSGAREHAIAKAFKKSPQPVELFCFASSNNPGIKELTTEYKIDSMTDVDNILAFALEHKIDSVFIGPEAPLAAGVADLLWQNNIPCIGPKQRLAQLETSKGFTRNLTTKYNIPGSPKYKNFSSLDGVNNFLLELGDLYVIKADGLMGGKGVKVAGDHLHSHEEAVEYCQELLDVDSNFVIEEKLIGQEFSLMSFCDGTHLAHMPAVQDHKRAFINDEGPNTGGMGTYSDADHKLPFLTDNDIKQAQDINQKTCDALRAKFDEKYIGILYGGFMATKDGVKLIEYNARLGDPEAMNVLVILESDFVSLCEAMIKGELTQNHAKFSSQATVCKYAVPNGYPDNPIKNERIDISEVTNKDQLYFASIDAREDGLYEIGSRAVAVVGVANTIYEAEQIAEAEINKIKGPLFHRKDIGTKELIEKRVQMMEELRRHPDSNFG